jgi:hypothetical protein
MKTKSVDQLVEQFLNDASFRTEFRSNPRAAAASRGIAVDDQLLSVVQSLSTTGANALESRISMLEPTNGC